MLYVWLVTALVLVTVVVLVALGRGDSELPATPDRRAADLPTDRPLVAEDIDALRLPQALRGYRMSDVDDVLDRVAAELTARAARIAELETGDPQTPTDDRGADERPADLRSTLEEAP